MAAPAGAYVGESAYDSSLSTGESAGIKGRVGEGMVGSIDTTGCFGAGAASVTSGS